MAEGKRHIAEDQPKIAFKTRDWQDRLNDPRPGGGGISWDEGEGGPQLSFEVEAWGEGEESREIRFWWEEGGPAQVVTAHYKAMGVRKDPKLKRVPIRYWNVDCPASCKKSRNFLYKVPGKNELACIKCANLIRRKQKNNDNRIGLARRDPKEFMRQREKLTSPRSIVATYKMVARAVAEEAEAQQRKEDSRLRRNERTRLRKKRYGFGPLYDET